MRSSTIVALAAIAAAAPSLAAPVQYARDSSSSAQAPSGSESDALSLGTVSTIASVAAPVVSGIIDHFKNNGNSNQRREAMEIEALLARSCGLPCNPKFVFPVRDSEDADGSGALSFSTIKDAASIGGSIISAVHNLFGGSNQQTQREVMELLARDGGDQSDALSLGVVKDVASIGSSVVSAVHSLFSGNNSQKKRELIEILARDDGDQSDALSLGTVKDVASIGSSVISAVHDLFSGSNQQKQRDAIELLARDGGDQSDALSLGVVKDVASIGSSVVSAVHDLFSGNNQQKKRELIEIFARGSGDQSDALSLGVVKDVASIGSSVVSAVHSLFGGNNQQRRTNIESMMWHKRMAARGDNSDESDAISLKTIGSIASFAAPVIGGIVDHFTNNGQQQSREFFDFEARDDESDAISLKTIGSIASFAAPVVGGIIDHFTNNGQQQSRELFERELYDLLARDGSDESDAISLKTIGSIASFAAPVVGGIIDHFTNNGQQQSRELFDFEARADGDESDAISLKTIGSIASFAAPAVGGIIDHFTNNGQQQSRELFERELYDLLARDGGDESDAISLKTIGSIASFAAPVVGGIIDHFTNSGQQQSREFWEGEFAARSLNDLD